MFEEIPKNRKYAYARVSSKSQEENSSLESQKQESLKQGVPQKNIRVEVGSENVGHLVDLCYVPSSEKAIVKQNILQGAVDKGSDAGIIFLNDIETFN